METILVQREKPQISQNVNFLTSTIFEKNDLRNIIKPEDKFLIRQGDIIVTNMELWQLQEIYLPKTALLKRNINIINDSHIIIEQKDKITLVHGEHGIEVLPKTNFHVYSVRSYQNRRVMD